MHIYFLLSCFWLSLLRVFWPSQVYESKQCIPVCSLFWFSVSSGCHGNHLILTDSAQLLLCFCFKSCSTSTVWVQCSKITWICLGLGVWRARACRAGVSACLAISHLIWFLSPVLPFASTWVVSQQIEPPGKRLGKTVGKALCLAGMSVVSHLLPFNSVHNVKQRVMWCCCCATLWTTLYCPHLDSVVDWKWDEAMQHLCIWILCMTIHTNFCSTH